MSLCLKLPGPSHLLPNKRQSPQKGPQVHRDLALPILSFRPLGLPAASGTLQLLPRFLQVSAQMPAAQPAFCSPHLELQHLSPLCFLSMALTAFIKQNYLFTYCVHHLNAFHWNKTFKRAGIRISFIPFCTSTVELGPRDGSVNIYWVGRLVRRNHMACYL